MDEQTPTERRLFGAHQIPNLICVLRVVFTFIGLAFLGHVHEQEGYWSAFWVTVLGAAALSDRLDGFLAKRYGWASPLGAALDQISDKLVTLALYCFISILGAYPLWAVALIVFRELFVTCLRIAANLGQIAIPTSQAGRFKTFSQQAAVLFIFMHWAWPTPVLAGKDLSQTVLWGGWLLFWLVMALLGRKGLEKFARIYSVTRTDPRTGEESRSRADLVLVWLTIVSIGLPLPYSGLVVPLVITLGTGGTYFAAFLWERRVRERSGGVGVRRILLSLVGSALLSIGLVFVLEAAPSFLAMWTLVAVLSLIWILLLTASYRTGQPKQPPSPTST